MQDDTLRDAEELLAHLEANNDPLGSARIERENKNIRARFKAAGQEIGEELDKRIKKSVQRAFRIQAESELLNFARSGLKFSTEFKLTFKKHIIALLQKGGVPIDDKGNPTAKTTTGKKGLWTEGHQIALSMQQFLGVFPAKSRRPKGKPSKLKSLKK